MPDGGSTIVGLSSIASDPRQGSASRHATMRGVARVRSGSAPEIVQPIRPSDEATSTFCGGPFQRRAHASAASSVVASAMSKRPKSIASSIRIGERSASRSPFGSVATTGPNSVDRTVTVDAAGPAPIATDRCEKGLAPSFVRYRSAFVGSRSRRTRSERSAVRLVKPHATCPLVPCTIAGTPGSDSPMSRPPSHTRSTRYQKFGAISVRCMSLPTMARPSRVREPATANAFDPGVSSDFGSPVAFVGFAPSAASLRRSSVFASGIASAAGEGLPSTVMSNAPRPEVKNAAISSPKAR